MKWLIRAVVALGLIAGTVVIYRIMASPTVININTDNLIAKYNHPSLDTTIILIHFGIKTYAIPRNYLIHFALPDSPGKNGGFDLEVLLPNLLPRTEGIADQFVKAGPMSGLGNQVSVSVRELSEGPLSSKELFAPDRQLDNFLKKAGKSRNDSRGVGGGYRLYNVSDTRDVFTKDTPDGLLVFSCGKMEVAPVAICRVELPAETRHGNITISFDRKYLHQSVEIVSKIQMLLETFVRK